MRGLIEVLGRTSVLWLWCLIAACADEGGGIDQGADGGVAEPPPAFPFTPSNIALGDLDLTGLEDVNVVGSCVFQDGEVTDCGNLKHVTLRQPGGGSDLGIFVARSFRIGPTGSVVVAGDRALVIVATDRIEIEGRLFAAATWISSHSPGGFRGADAIAGAGPGGGANGDPTPGARYAAGGGGHCGAGGAGGTKTLPGSAGGEPYGSPELVPLIGGSAGGVGGVGLDSGPGGGAIQLVAGNSVTVGPSGTIHVGGGGGNWLGGGGGSGGGILIESRAVTVAGTLAANGGGGGAMALAQGGDGLPGPAPAPGGGVAMGGGAGSAAAIVDGAAGATSEEGPGGGGGGAGRIRINTAPGRAAALDGARLSPSAGTPCVSEGTVH